ncbi:hypothetical protein Pint_02738 [Pistacia integerrima]|uniref:Uncharacterized protein n=1 Tax=Pistacia integerrima TaxID=434235 RepID=A0ACC0ZIF4_9ROSI|nr:hypothetical protein Pint_02738 [Pistacia integerrima]
MTQMLIEIATAIVSKVGEYLVEPTINQARYLFRFNKIVEDLMEAERNLKSKQGDVEKEIEAAKRNDERIKATVQDWLSDSRKIMGEVETLKGKIEVNKTCLNGWCPNWVSRHQLGRKATKTSIRLKKVIVDGGQIESMGRRALLLEFDFELKIGVPLSKGCKMLLTTRYRELTKEKGWKQYTAISLLENKLEELSVRLECPKLKILLLGGEKQWFSNQLKVSDECFQEMKAVEVVSLRSADLSLKSLQFLTNLKTLELSDCNLRDICFLAKLNKLEILSFRGSCFEELPIELSELKELRVLDLRGCSALERIPSNLIRSFSQLEELYMEEDIFEEREVEEKSMETGNARLSELNDLSSLAVLYLKINSKCLPKDFAFSELSRYEICVSDQLGLDDEAGLIQLKNLEIEDAAELKQVFHGKEENEVAEEGKDIKLPNLKKLNLYKLGKLTRFFPENNHSNLSALEERLIVVMKYCSIQLYDEILFELRCGFLKIFEELRINDCEVKEMLELEGLAKLVSFFPEKYAACCPALEEFRVKDCSKLTTTFIVEEVAPKDDSPEEKAPEIGSEDESQEEQAPEMGSEDESQEEQAPEMSSEDDTQEEQAPEIGSEDESHEEMSTDLICRWGAFKILPRYIKNEELYSNSHPTE